MAFGARDVHRDSYLPLDRYRLRNLNDLKPFRSTESLKRDSTYLPERSAAVGRRDHKASCDLRMFRPPLDALAVTLPDARSAA